MTRAEEYAGKRFGFDTPPTRKDRLYRREDSDLFDACCEGYEQAEKDTINRAVEWLEQALSFGIHPCNGHSTVMQFKETMEKEEQ